MKPPDALTEIEAIKGKLKASPLSQLSLTSSELFHSNFLVWLCENHPKIGCSVFGKFVSCQPMGIKNAKREKKKIDLWLDFTNNEELIVENKVKSIPTRGQLVEYSKKASSDKTSFLLLSLSRPLFFRDDKFKVSNEICWRYLNYSDLAASLESALNQSKSEKLRSGSYHRQLIDDYIEFIRELDKLYKYYSIKFDQTECFYEPVDTESFRNDRLSSGVLKMRYAQLAGMLNEKLQTFPLVNEYSDLWKAERGSVVTYSDMTRATGVMGFNYLLMDQQDETPAPLALGVQLQDNHFRLVVTQQSGDARPSAEVLYAETIVDRQWFNFSHLKIDANEQEYPKKGDFNKYRKDFFYRSKRLNKDALPIAPSALVEAFLTYFNFIRDNSEVLRERFMASN